MKIESEEEAANSHNNAAPRTAWTIHMVLKPRKREARRANWQWLGGAPKRDVARRIL